MYNFTIAEIITYSASKVYGKSICAICEAVFIMGIVKRCSTVRLGIGAGEYNLNVIPCVFFFFCTGQNNFQFRLQCYRTECLNDG